MPKHPTEEAAAHAKYLFEQSLLRPADYHRLSPQEQWDTDKQLGILDWDGSCEHSACQMCDACWKRYNESANVNIGKSG